MSISLSNNMLKIWEFPIFSCILTLKNINSNGSLYSACFLNNDNSNIIERYNYIITSCAGSNEQIKIFDFDGNIIKKFEQKDSDDVYFIDSYFDLKLKKYFIITGNYNYIKSYDFYETKLYKKYIDEKYLFVGCRDRTIKLITISRNKVINSLQGHINWISCVKKIKHSEYGECLISQGDLNDQIKIWVDKNFIK